MRKHYTELCPVVKYGFTVVADRSYGTRERPQATASRYAQYGKTAMAIPSWSKGKLPVRCAILVTRPASFSS